MAHGLPPSLGSLVTPPRAASCALAESSQNPRNMVCPWPCESSPTATVSSGVCGTSSPPPAVPPSDQGFRTAGCASSDSMARVVAGSRWRAHPQTGTSCRMTDSISCDRRQTPRDDTPARGCRRRSASGLLIWRVIVARHRPADQTPHKQIGLAMHGFRQQPLEVHDDALDGSACVALGTCERSHQRLERQRHAASRAMCFMQRRDE